MKKLTRNRLPASIIIAAFFIVTFLRVDLNAQQITKLQVINKDKMPHDCNQEIPTVVKEKIAAAKKRLIERDNNLHQHKNSYGNPPLPMSCGDIGAENGWSTWKALTGVGNTSGTVPTMSYVLTWDPPVPTPAAPRFNLTSGTGVDPCTPGTHPVTGAPGPAIPIVAPGFGNQSIQLGVPEDPGNGGTCPSNACVEQITYTFIPTVQDTNFIYAFAAIFYDPPAGAGGHQPLERPYVDFVILEANGDTVDCSYQHYVSQSNLPGFYRANTSCYGSPEAYYKPWTTVGVNLSKHVGNPLTIVVTNSDCTQGGHYAHSYWDFACPPITGSSTPYCQGQPTTITGPASDPSNPYTYTWYQNGNPYTGSPNATSQFITPIAQLGDTFSVKVHQSSGCDFWIPFVPEPMSTVASFTTTGVCGQMNFTDQSSSSHATYPISVWNWQFPGGTPSTANVQNPGTILYPAGTYTATLTVSTSAGCPSTTTYTFTVGGFPTAAVIPTTPCLGVATTLTDGSVPSQGDPIASWSWSMPGGNPSTATSPNTSTVYNTAGTHIVTLLIVSQKGCPDTITQQVLVYNPPVANFTAPDSGCAPVCANYTDISQSIDGAINNWAWNFPGGTPSSSTVQHPQNICYNTPGSYDVSVIVTTQYGCKDTVTLPMIEVFPWPQADFCVAPAIAPTTDPVFNFCDMWSPDVVKWSWDFGDNSTDLVNTDPVHSYSATANANDFYTYNICLRVENKHGCYDDICHPVELVPEFTFYIPNTFTPNGDFMNELFYGKSRGVKEYNIWLFDRWGNQIWDCHKDDKNTNWDSDATAPKQEGLSSFCKWDGKVVSGGMDMGGNSRQLAQEDVYVWKVKLTDIFEKQHSYVGHVSVVR